MADAKVCDICGRGPIETDKVEHLPFKVYDWYPRKGDIPNVKKGTKLEDVMWKTKRTRDLDVCGFCYDEYHTWLVEFITSKVRLGVMT